MLPRDRVRAAVEFRGPDRVPTDHYIFPGAFWRHGQALIDLVNEHEDDSGNRAVRMNMAVAPGDPNEIIEWRDQWGTLWRRLGGYTSGDVVEPALPTWDRWGDYVFPPPMSDEAAAKARAEIESRQPRYYTRGAGGSIFQTAQHIRGPANFLMDLAEDRPEAHELVDRLVEHHIANIRKILPARPDAIGFGDDLGAQTRLLMRPDTWRRFYKPRYQRLFAVARDGGAHVWFHTDGWTLEILEDLVEIGVQILNPQHAIMGDQRVAERIAGRVCLRTDIDRQHLIPRGTPEEITASVKALIALFGIFDGGLILHGEVGPDVPLENIRALYEAFREYGQYPLSWLHGG